MLFFYELYEDSLFHISIKFSAPKWTRFKSMFHELLEVPLYRQCCLAGSNRLLWNERANLTWNKHVKTWANGENKASNERSRLGKAEEIIAESVQWWDIPWVLVKWWFSQYGCYKCGFILQSRSAMVWDRPASLPGSTSNAETPGHLTSDYNQQYKILSLSTFCFKLQIAAAQTLRTAQLPSHCGSREQVNTIMDSY